MTLAGTATGAATGAAVADVWRTIRCSHPGGVAGGVLGSGIA